MHHSQKLSESEIDLITGALDQICDEYDANNKTIFQSESERARQQFASVRRRMKDWSKSRQCVVPGCSQRSIARSHTIPKSMSLRVIDEAGHVLAPSYDRKRHEATVEMVGLSDATTFPGFCETHELLFRNFENLGSISTSPDVYLQIYRVGCRELFRVRFMIKQHDWTMAEYCKARDEGLLRLIRERALSLGLQSTADFNSILLESDPLVDDVNEKILPVRELCNHLEQRLLPALERTVFHSDDSGVCVRATQLDVEIPVALAGSGSFLRSENGVENRFFLLINVVPEAGRTLIIMAALAEEEHCLEDYASMWIIHPLRILSMIESWMINGTDQWCIRPSTWQKLPNSRAIRLLKALLGDERNVGQECDDSIFDELRSDFIQTSDAVNAEVMTPKYIKFIDSERRKMA